MQHMHDQHTQRQDPDNLLEISASHRQIKQRINLDCPDTCLVCAACERTWPSSSLLAPPAPPADGSSPTSRCSHTGLPSGPSAGCRTSPQR